MSRSLTPLCRVLVPLLIWITSLLPSPGDSITLIPTGDTSIFEKAPDNNMGSSQTFAAGNTATPDPARALIRFSLDTSLPAGTRITSVMLQLQALRASILSEPATFALHRLLVDWGEGNKDANLATGIGTLASEGEATWAARFHPDQSWAMSGGSAGVDFSVLASASADITGVQTLVFTSNSALVADVQSWLDAPGSNFGWLLKDQFETIGATARRFGSRENPTSPPQLIIEYEAPLRIERTSLVEGEICMSFTARAGRTYRLEARDKINSGSPEILATREPGGTTVEAVLCDVIVPTTGSRFYQITEE